LFFSSGFEAGHYQKKFLFLEEPKDNFFLKEEQKIIVNPKITLQTVKQIPGKNKSLEKTNP